MYAVQNKRWTEATLLNPCQRNLAILSHIIDIITNEIMYKDFNWCPLFQRLKVRKPLSYGFLTFVTFAYTHFKVVEATRIELVSENLFIRLSTSVFYLLKFPVQTADKRAENTGSPNTIYRHGHSCKSFTTNRCPNESRGSQS